MTESWDTRDKLDAMRAATEQTVPGWRPPVAWGVAISSASSEPGWTFPHVNHGGGLLPAVILGRLVRHSRTTETLPVTADVLTRATEDLAPAEACSEVDHPNLVAWRELLDAVATNPARELCVVYVDDLDDPVSSEADGEMRALLSH